MRVASNREDPRTHFDGGRRSDNCDDPPNDLPKRMSGFAGIADAINLSGVIEFLQDFSR